MTDINEDDVTQLVDKIKDLSLSLPDPQRGLLMAILKVASDIRDETEDVPERAFTRDFQESFTKKQADLVLRYASVVPPFTIIRNPPGTITNSLTRPAAIIKAPPPDPESDE
jgi:hypothetical protein